MSWDSLGALYGVCALGWMLSRLIHIHQLLPGLTGPARTAFVGLAVLCLLVLTPLWPLDVVARLLDYWRRTPPGT